MAGTFISTTPRYAAEWDEQAWLPMKPTPPRAVHIKNSRDGAELCCSHRDAAHSRQLPAGRTIQRCGTYISVRVKSFVAVLLVCRWSLEKSATARDGVILPGSGR